MMAPWPGYVWHHQARERPTTRLPKAAQTVAAMKVVADHEAAKACRRCAAGICILSP